MHCALIIEEWTNSSYQEVFTKARSCRKMSIPVVKEYVSKVLATFKELLPDIEEVGNIRSVIVFGSATRPQDFVIGVSDIDILIITHKRPYRRYHAIEIHGTEVNISFMTLDELYDVFKRGVPLSFMLYRSSYILMDDGSFSNLITSNKPQVTKHTLKILYHSIFVALELGLERYFTGSFRKSVSHAYHSMRHLARYKAALNRVKPNKFPISDVEVRNYLSKYAREIFDQLVKLRRRDITQGECEIALNNTIGAISLELECEVPSLYEIKENIKELENNISFVKVKKKECHVVVIIGLLTHNGHKILEIGKGHIKRINRIGYYGIFLIIINYEINLISSHLDYSTYRL